MEPAADWDVEAAGLEAVVSVERAMIEARRSDSLAGAGVALGVVLGVSELVVIATGRAGRLRVASMSRPPRASAAVAAVATRSHDAERLGGEMAAASSSANCWAED